MQLQPPDKATSRAVFIGTTEYHPSTRLQQLANVDSSVRRLRHLLCERAEAVFDAELCPAPLLNPARSRVALEALERAAGEAEDVLLVYYAGHAVSLSKGNEDRLYLVLSEAQYPRPDWDSLDFGEVRAILRTSRARVRILILDCCFSGVAAQGVLSGGEPPLTTELLQQMTLEEGWHIVTSSAADRTADDSDGHGYTAFTGKLIDGLEQGVDRAPGGAEPAYLGMESLFSYARARLPEQAPQILQNGTPHVALGPNPRRLPPEYEQWTDVVETFLRGWAPAAAELDPTVELARKLVLRLAQSCQDEPRLANDPWRSAGFAVRMCEHLTDMVKRACGRAGDPLLNQAEALLVGLMPFVYATWWDGALGESLKSTDPERDLLGERPAAVDGSDGPRGSYREFLERRPDAVRRARSAVLRGNETAARAICWWLYRHWVLNRAFIERKPDPLQAIGALLEETGEPSRTMLRRLFGLYGRFTLQQVLDPLMSALLASPDPRLRVGKPTTDTDIRAGLIARLLSVAHQMAVDPFALPTAIDHVNAGSSFTPEVLRERFWSWQRLSRDGSGTVGYDLGAECASPEVASVLRAHVTAMDRYVLRVTHPDNGLPEAAALGDVIPLRYSSLGVRPGPDDRFSLTEMRLTLDDDSVRELLMGQQIYHHPEAAVRELFQNALDACRHRDRRLAFLRHQRGDTEHGGDWRGKITFVRGHDDRRPYIECRDNGVGMGEQELEKLFARGGMRFTTSQEYLEEQVDWRRAGIQLQPNSIFGIGVYSYFLLADEIRVVTRRFNRDGELGQGLQIDISGPGALFHIKPLAGIEAGTAVRLYLKQDLDLPPLHDVLGRWVWTSDYDLDASEEGTDEVFRLRAGRLNERAARHGTAPVATSGSPGIWWCPGEGGVLRDGIWIGHPVFGAVVNLTGAAAPDLTIDRNHPRDPAAIAVDALLADRVDALVRAEAGVLTPTWLSELAKERPALADTVLRAAVENGLPGWQLGGRDADIAVVGCFVPDVALWAGQTGPGAGEPSAKPAKGDADSRLLRKADEILENFPPFVADWRARAWAKAGLLPGVGLADGESPPVALPSDALLLDLQSLSDAKSYDYEAILRAHVRGRRSVRRNLVEAAERLDATLPPLLARLCLLGQDERVFHSVPRQPAGDDRETPLPIGAQAGWLSTDAPVPMGYILDMARFAECPPRQVRDRLERVGYRTPETRYVPEAATAAQDDLIILSVNVTGTGRWLEPDDEVPLSHLLVAAAALESTPRQVAERLTELGHRLPAHAAAHPAWHTTLRKDDCALLSRDCDGSPPWLDVTAEVPVEQLLVAASVTDSTPRWVAERLTRLGLSVSADARTHPAWEVILTHSDRMLLSRDLGERTSREDESRRWMPLGTRIPTGHLFAAAETVKRTPRQVADRFTRLGYVTDDGAGEWPRSGRLSDDDLALISESLDGTKPSLDPMAEVRIGHVLAAAKETAYSAREAVARLRQLGYIVPDIPPQTLRSARVPRDALLLSVDLDGLYPWLDPAADVPPGHLLAAAAATKSTPEQVAERLALFGHRVHESAAGLAAWRTVLSKDDLILLSSDVNGKEPWRRFEDDVSPDHLLVIAATLGRTPQWVADRYGVLGYRTVGWAAGHPVWQTTLRRGDLPLLGAGDGHPNSTLHVATPVPLTHIVHAAVTEDQEPGQVWARLEQLGFTPPPGVVFPRREAAADGRAQGRKSRSGPPD
ncbi:caspase, EACC1-associated type [Actinacidiphila paucisporea]|uniref:Caspase domain-containing protein n=1 Tax=Actinacidiphila paucisporea TaxID=310782 RepID=A0A1M6Z8Q8_9ACTN|nr:caspase family protein [Actinacidiphila paucisporea]SHL26856.1 Caspase domain-containing protein [Actinacidiphila paucisporea]